MVPACADWGCSASALYARCGFRGVVKPQVCCGLWLWTEVGWLGCAIEGAFEYIFTSRTQICHAELEPDSSRCNRTPRLRRTSPVFVSFLIQVQLRKFCISYPLG